MISSGARGTKPMTEVSGNCVEICSQSVCRERWGAIRLQAQLQVVGESHRIIVFAVTQVKRGQDFCDWINLKP